MDTSTGFPGTEADTRVPTHLVSDYVEMAYLSVVLLVGLPINLHILFKLLQGKRKSGCYSVKRGFLLMKINLNISDTLILTVNVAGKLAWLATYQWRAGNGMCRLYKFVSVATLALSSNMVVCIAVDRLRTVLSAQRLRRESGVNGTKLILVFAWVVAFVSSIPNFFVFQTFDVLQAADDGGWYQCTDMWAIQEHLVSTGAANESGQFPFTDTTKNSHELSHLFIVFYGPLIIMAVSYFIIAVKLTKYSNGFPQKESAKTFDTTMTLTAAAASPKNLKLTFNSASPTKFSQYEYSQIEQSNSHQVVSPRISLEEKKKPNRVLKVLKDEFNYCVCVQTDDEMRPKLSNRSVITEDGNSMFSLNSTPMFTWTPVTSKKRKLTSSSSRLSLQKLNLKKSNSSASTVRRQPAWRRQLRSRVFKTTLLVVVTHIIFWLPYNFISLLRYFNTDAHTSMTNHMNVFEDMQFLIALVNPFLYGFGASL